MYPRHANTSIARAPTAADHVFNLKTAITHTGSFHSPSGTPRSAGGVAGQGAAGPLRGPSRYPPHQTASKQPCLPSRHALWCLASVLANLGVCKIHEWPGRNTPMRAPPPHAQRQLPPKARSSALGTCALGSSPRRPCFGPRVGTSQRQKWLAAHGRPSKFRHHGFGLRQRPFAQVAASGPAVLS